MQWLFLITSHSWSCLFIISNFSMNWWIYIDYVSLYLITWILSSSSNEMPHFRGKKVPHGFILVFLWCSFMVKAVQQRGTKNAMAPIEIVYYSLLCKSRGRVVGLYDISWRQWLLYHSPRHCPHLHVEVWLPRCPVSPSGNEGGTKEPSWCGKTQPWDGPSPFCSHSMSENSLTCFLWLCE